MLAAVIAAGQAGLQAPPDGGKTNPGSLYGPGSASIFADRTARNTGDLVTVIVDEQSLATYAASTSTSKSDRNSVNFKLFANFLDDLFKPIMNGTGADSSSDGKGQTSHQSRMATRMSAIVKEAQPNGLLVIEGSRSLVTNKDTQTFVLSGIIRAMDIAPDNTIRSSQIAEAEIRMTGKGVIADRQRRGILTTIIDWLF